MATKYMVLANALTGGADGALDAWDCTSMPDGSLALVDTGSIVYHYTYDSGSSTAESSPFIVAPDTGAGRWLLTGVSDASTLYIDGSGNVGIGTTSPASKLDVYNDTFTDFREGTGNIYLSRATSDESSGIKIQGKVSHNAYVGCMGGTDALSLGHDDGSSDVDAITILTSGFVGVGVTSPVTKLDVDGAITQHELSADPSDPAEGTCVTWMSDGTGSGDDGDIMMKITAGGTTKTVTLVDFSES